MEENTNNTINIEKDTIISVTNGSNNTKMIAGAILIAGVLIAGAILLKGRAPSPTQNEAKVNLKDIKIKPIANDEHIQGNKNAKVVLVEYSDTECPFSKMYHGTTIPKLIQEKGADIAVVYKHFPIAQLHPKAFHEAVATECAYEQGGNDTFFKYLNEVYLKTESNNKLDPAELPKIAKDLNLDMAKFNSCLDTEKYADKVKADMQSGNDAGVNGTPKSFILKNGKVVDTVDGAYPYEEVLKKINTALK